MNNLTWKCVSSMKKNKDNVNNQLSTAEKTDLISAYARLGVNLIDINLPMDSDARMVSVGGTTPSPNTMVAEVQEWCDLIHAQTSLYGSSIKVLHRGTFCGIENIWGFPFDKTTAMGSAASAATDGETTWCGRYYNYLYNIVGTHVQTGDIFAPIPEGTTHAFDGNWFSASQAAYMQLFSDLHAITDTYATAKGVTLKFISANNFSELASGYIFTIPTDQSAAGADYYGQRQGATFNRPQDYVTDWQQLYLGKDSNGGGNNSCAGVDQFQGEWGDINGNATPSYSTIEQRMHYLIQFYKAYRDNLVPPNGHMTGFSFWGGWEGQNTSLLYKDGNGKYQLNAWGQMLKNFYLTPGSVRVPVTTGSGTSDHGSQRFA